MNNERLTTKMPAKEWIKRTLLGGFGILACIFLGFACGMVIGALLGGDPVANEYEYEMSAVRGMYCGAAIGLVAGVWLLVRLLRER